MIHANVVIFFAELPKLDLTEILLIHLKNPGFSEPLP